MLVYTDTAHAPWTIVKYDDKKRSRLNCMRHSPPALPYTTKDARRVGRPDPLIVASADMIGGGDAVLGR